MLCFWEEFEDTKRVIRIRISKNKQHNGQKKKYKKRSTKQSHKTKDRETRTPLKTGGELRCSVRVNSSCSTSCTRSVDLVTNPVTSEWGKDRDVFTSGTYPWSFMTQIFHKCHGGDQFFFEVMTSLLEQPSIKEITSSGISWGMWIQHD
jgi:hypothetical protein